MIESNREIAVAFLLECFAGEIDIAGRRMAPDATWWTLGDPDRIRVSGERGTEQVIRFLMGVQRGFDNGMRADILGSTAEGDRVAIEVASSARLVDGGTYSNRYHFLIELRNGLITRVREYMDTDCVRELQEHSARSRHS